MTTKPERRNRHRVKPTRQRTYCTAAPDWLPSCGDISGCCKAHDKAYAEGGNEADRFLADLALRDCIAARAYERGHYVRGWLVSRIYFRAVRLCGAMMFNWKRRKVDLFKPER